MKTRIITATVALAAFIPVLFFSDTIVFPIVIGVLAAVAGYEMCGAAGTGNKWYVTVPTALFCFGLPLLIGTKLYDFIPLAIVAYGFYMLCLCVIAFPKVSAKSLMASTAMAYFAAVSFSIIVATQRDFDTRYDYLLLFICAWATDTFAIFGGKFFGKHKLAPNLSPKKTVEGLISGVLGSVIAFFVFALVLDHGLGLEINYAKRLLLAVPGALIAQLGDLAASAIKRDCGIKDYGKLFPGHGGVMDRFDSVMFLSVAALLYLWAEEMICGSACC